MDVPEVKAFNAELSRLYENRPISKSTMGAITRAAIKAIKFYRHVVHSVEKFIHKCKPEYKVPGLYVIDSIVKQSRHQFGQDKDVFAPRFAKNMQQTFANLFRCPDDDKNNIIRVLNLWQKNNVFSPEVIQPLLDMADPNHPLRMEIMQQQNNTAKESSLNVSHNTSNNEISPMPRQDSPHTSSPMGDAIESKDDMANEPDVQFIETAPQVIEISDDNDSRSPSPRWRHRSRSKSPRSRRRPLILFPRRRRDKDRYKDKNFKEREAEKEKQMEREEKGLPPIKKLNLSNKSQVFMFSF